MSSSPLRRVLSAALLLTALSVLPSTVEARALSIRNDDSAVASRFEGLDFLGRLWAAFSHLWATDGARIDPNGVH
ncbi:MAG TPA: hypothetical protein VFE33_22575 [Thermoanaerobaculia bacterium]|nr:hypothetical protein [Thermoanaerobaculia bacterium]